MAHDLYDQWEKCKTAKGKEREYEAFTLEQAYKAANGLKGMAEIQLEQLRLTGFLPDENMLLDGDEVKLINAKRNVTTRHKTNQPLLDEFVK